MLVFQTERLAEPVTISGEVAATLFASTSGTDADRVVKLIDVFPPEVRSNPVLGGCQLMVSADILRGRYRDDPSHPTAVEPGVVEEYRVRMPEANHTFAKGHGIMVQVQSSWFPRCDRNPQQYVDRIADAKPGDYRAATMRVWFAPGQASTVEVHAAAPGPP